MHLMQYDGNVHSLPCMAGTAPRIVRPHTHPHSSLAGQRLWWEYCRRQPRLRPKHLCLWLSLAPRTVRGGKNPRVRNEHGRAARLSQLRAGTSGTHFSICSASEWSKRSSHLWRFTQLVKVGRPFQHQLEASILNQGWFPTKCLEEQKHKSSPGSQMQLVTNSWRGIHTHPSTQPLPRAPTPLPPVQVGGWLVILHESTSMIYAPKCTLAMRNPHFRAVNHQRTPVFPVTKLATNGHALIVWVDRLTIPKTDGELWAMAMGQNEPSQTMMQHTIHCIFIIYIAYIVTTQLPYISKSWCI